jgi:hypothetical protein
MLIFIDTFTRQISDFLPPDIRSQFDSTKTTELDVPSVGDTSSTHSLEVLFSRASESASREAVDICFSQ